MTVETNFENFHNGGRAEVGTGGIIIVEILKNQLASTFTIEKDCIGWLR